MPTNAPSPREFRTSIVRRGISFSDELRRGLCVWATLMVDGGPTMNVPSRDPAIESEIAKRAHDIWVEEGRPHGRDEAHWTQAETEVLSGLADHLLPGEVATPAATADDPVNSPTEAPKKTPARRKPAAKRTVAGKQA
jgi:Protein of unknown function (DUF2934)